jgi:S-adenosylmethionine-dependent methyltransferase
LIIGQEGKVLSEIEEFYDGAVEREWLRLERHRMEFAVTMRVLAEHLPAPPASILDVGSGPGRYAIALADCGYRVTLVDLSKKQLDLAREKAQQANVELSGYIYADARHIPQISDESHDAVLLMGPLYHLLTQEERMRALREAHRVLIQGGIVFASFICRYAPIRYSARWEPDFLVRNYEECLRLIETGINAKSRTGYFTEAYFAHPSEIKPLMEKAGFRSEMLISCEGIIGRIEEAINELTGDAWERWVEINYRIGQDPSVYGAAEHLLYVGRKVTIGET